MHKSRSVVPPPASHPTFTRVTRRAVLVHRHPTSPASHAGRSSFVGDPADLLRRHAVPVHHVPAQGVRHGELLVTDAAGRLSRVPLHVFSQIAAVVVGGAAHGADLQRHRACGRRAGDRRVSGREEALLETVRQRRGTHRRQPQVDGRTESLATREPAIAAGTHEAWICGENSQFERQK